MEYLAIGLLFLLCLALYFSIKIDRARDKRLILLILLENYESHGNELMEISRGHFGGDSLYPLLRIMEREGLLESREDGSPDALAARGGHPRIMYRLTPSGYKLACLLKNLPRS